MNSPSITRATARQRGFLPVTDPCGPLTTPISFGTDIRRPAQLMTRTAGELLDGVRDGQWRSAVTGLRALPLESGKQRQAKTKLPFMTWSGEFSRRNSGSLLRHSGIVGIDLDSLAAPETRRVMHCALDDPHCLAAFRSASGHGVRLLVRVQPTTAEHHKVAFDAAAAHVRDRYEIEPDIYGSDVSRASFVSWDGQILINPQATILPTQHPSLHSGNQNHCVNRVVWGVPWWVWLAREFMPHRTREDGTALTHHTLLRLGQRIALRAAREKLWLREENVESTVDAWFGEMRRRGIRLRGEVKDYRAELWQIVVGVRKCDWFNVAADIWTRWTREQSCPSEPKERILYAIRRHCDATRNREFYLSCRDAGAIGGVSHMRASQILSELGAQGFIRRMPKPRPARHSITYRLLE